MIINYVAITGFLSFILFIAAMITGIRRFRLFRYHRTAGLFCFILTILHSICAFSFHMIDPFGLLASVFMIFAFASGYFAKKRFRVHIIFSLLTVFFAVIHVLLMLYVN